MKMIQSKFYGKSWKLSHSGGIWFPKQRPLSAKENYISFEKQFLASDITSVNKEYLTMKYQETFILISHYNLGADETVKSIRQTWKWSDVKWISRLRLIRSKGHE